MPSGPSDSTLAEVVEVLAILKCFFLSHHASRTPVNCELSYVLSTEDVNVLSWQHLFPGHPQKIRGLGLQALISIRNAGYTSNSISCPNEEYQAPLWIAR